MALSSMTGEKYRASAAHPTTYLPRMNRTIYSGAIALSISVQVLPSDDITSRMNALANQLD
jgi:hypothetical protein